MRPSSARPSPRGFDSDVVDAELDEAAARPVGSDEHDPDRVSCPFIEVDSDSLPRRRLANGHAEVAVNERPDAALLDINLERVARRAVGAVAEVVAKRQSTDGRRQIERLGAQGGA